MKLNQVALFLMLAVGLISGSGCYSSLDGRTKAGLPTVNDTISARYERGPLEIWQAAKDVLNYNGTLYSEDTLKSTLEASVNERTVWVHVQQLSPQVTQVLVQARTKFGGTDVALAAEIDKQIAIRLASGNLTPFAPRAPAAP